MTPVRVVRRASAKHRPRPARRRHLRPLVGAALVIAGLLAPVESVPLPAGPAGLLGDATALAQGTVPAFVLGTPENCPTVPSPWTPSTRGTECILESHACPWSPVNTDNLLEPSVDQPSAVDMASKPILRYPGFCEERHLEATDPTDYGACSSATGFIVRTHEMQQLAGPGGIPITMHMCRLIHPAMCTVGNRAASDTCRAVGRRSWTCPAGYTPRNDYLSCHNASSSAPAGPHPACGPGSPDFVVLSCEDYVGADYVETPATVDCTGYDTGTHPMWPNSQLGSASDHWCEFDTSFLKVVCHSLNPPAADCVAAVGRCLKRTSGTGGCNAIANTIRCREYQAKYADTVSTGVTAQDVLDAGCEPCYILPFQPSPPALSCPRITGAPNPGTPHPAHVALAREKKSFAVHTIACADVRSGAVPLELATACLAKKTCDGDAGRDHLTWTSSHHSGLVVVNSPTIFSIVDHPASHESSYKASFDGGSMFLSMEDLVRYIDNKHGDPFVRIWPRVDSSVKYDDVQDYLRTARSGPCWVRYTDSPEFRVVVEELWPDTAEQETAIREFFGPQSLDWWTVLSPAEKRRRTEARGFVYLDSTSTQTQIDSELAARSAARTEDLFCGVLGDSWCRWLPTRSGFYQAIGVRIMTVRWAGASRQWKDSSHITQLETYLNTPANRDVIQDFLNDEGLQAADLGLDPSLTSVLPRPPHADPTGHTDEWLYSEEAGAQFRCPTLDLRVLCSGAGTTNSGVYGPIDPVGIRVHEVRVATRLPNL